MQASGICVTPQLPLFDETRARRAEIFPITPVESGPLEYGLSSKGGSMPERNSSVMIRNAATVAGPAHSQGNATCAPQAHWYVVQTKPRQESRALEQLQNQNYDCYLPTLQVTKLCRGKRIAVVEPLFSRYLFIRLNSANSAWSPIRNTRGVSGMVAFGERFATLPDDYVNALKTMPPSASVNLPAPGDRVTITAGPFAGLQGLYQLPDGESRAFVLIELMRQPQKISLPFDVLSQAH